MADGAGLIRRLLGAVGLETSERVGIETFVTRFDTHTKKYLFTTHTGGEYHFMEHAALPDVRSAFEAMQHKVMEVGGVPVVSNINGRVVLATASSTPQETQAIYDWSFNTVDEAHSYLRQLRGIAEAPPAAEVSGQGTTHKWGAFIKAAIGRTHSR